MVNFVTSAEGAIPRSTNKVVAETPSPSAPHELRCQRMRQLREAIENGQYHVAAAELADALLRAARSAN